MNCLFQITKIDNDVGKALAEIGDIFADLGDGESGCKAHGVKVEGTRFFIKYVVNFRGMAAQDRAIAMHRAVQHPTIVPLLHIIAGKHGPILIYPWIDGHRLRDTRKTAELPLAKVLDAISDIIDAHCAIETAGFVSIDLYDGNFLYTDRIHLIDIDEYEQAPHVLRVERTLGSTRFMAPEEFRKGSILNSRTMVFQLGRTAAVLLDPPSGTNCARAPMFKSVIARSTMPETKDRYQTVREFAKAWQDQLMSYMN